MKIMELTEKLGSLGKSTKDSESMITITEAHLLWTTLSSRYNDINKQIFLMTLSKMKS